MFHNPKIEDMGAGVNQFGVSTPPDEVATIEKLNHLIELFTIFRIELKLMAAILLAQGSDGVDDVEILARLHLWLDQPPIYETDTAVWERNIVLDLDNVVVELLQRFLEKKATYKREVTSPHTISLSERELEVLQLIAEGSSNKEIADRLYIGMSTVKKHINHIYDKLDVKNRTQAVAIARERQILTH